MNKTTGVIGLVFILALSLLAILIFSRRHQPSVIRPSYTTLHQAAVFDPEQIPLLVKAGSKLDELDADGHTPLWVASRYRKARSVHHLLSLGANADLGGQGADAPILVATFMGSSPESTKIVRELIDAGADVNVASGLYAETPLHYAVRNNNLEVVELLLDAHANVNAQSTSGDTPLQTAVVKGHAEIASLLLQADADPELRNRVGFRPIDQLNSCPHPEQIQAAFKANGADDQRRPDLIAAADSTHEK